MTRAEYLYVTAEEIAALITAARGMPGPPVVPLSGTGAGVCINPATRDKDGLYPRWMVLRLAVLRNLDITSMEITDGERVELLAFAAEHGKELVG